MADTQAQPEKQELEIKKDKRCFIITPLGMNNSETRRNADGLISAIIEPVLTEFGYECIPPHRISDLGSITNHIIKNLVESELVIANLTELNPNVMYELAIRHSFGKPVICLVQNGTDLPFDIKGDRTIFYNNDYADVNLTKENLRNAIYNLGTLIEDNPVTRALQFNSEVNNLIAQGKPEDAILLGKISAIERKLDMISSPIKGNVKNSDDSIYFYSGSKGISFIIRRIDGSTIDSERLGKMLNIFSKNYINVTNKTFIKSVNSNYTEVEIGFDFFMGVSDVDLFVDFMKSNGFIVHLP